MKFFCIDQKSIDSIGAFLLLTTSFVCFELTVSVTVLPLRLTEVQKMASLRLGSEEEEDRAESAVSSCLSMRSDWTKGKPLDFSNGPSDTQ